MYKRRLKWTNLKQTHCISFFHPHLIERAKERKKRRPKPCCQASREESKKKEGEFELGAWEIKVSSWVLASFDLSP